MASHNPAPTAAHRRRSTFVAAVVVASAALLGILGYQSWPASSRSTTGPIAAAPVAHRPHDGLPRDPRGRPGSPPSNRHGPIGEAEGVVPDGVTTFDGGSPAVANLDADLLGALRPATTDAAADGVEIVLSSGWRSRRYQAQLLREAIAEYGSREEAARWVATPNTSAHVSGDAVDVESVDAEAWLSEHGAMYGLCQIYRNEPWHYELRSQAIDRGCPPMYADPTYDPRMQR